jgi:hypothetical protein
MRISGLYYKIVLDKSEAVKKQPHKHWHLDLHLTGTASPALSITS